MANDEVNPLGLPTTNYGWIKPTVGGDGDAWGGLINTDLDGIDTTVKSIQTSVPAASSTTPAMDGTATIGVGTTYARADHIHPTDTSRAAATALANYLLLTGGTLTGGLVIGGPADLKTQTVTQSGASLA